MIRSMTGYGRSIKIIDGKEITVEIKSVNHRYFEFNARVPRIYGYLEEKLKNHIQPKTSRGKIDVSVNIVTLEGLPAEVEINHALAQGYINAMRSAGERYALSGELAVIDLTRFPDIFTVRKTTEEENVVWEEVRSVCDEALDVFVTMREIEGKKMLDDILSRLDFIQEMTAKVEERSPQRVKEYREKLLAKMTTVLEDTAIDEQRILTEAAIYSEKIAVDEETVRLRSHLSQFRQILAAGGGVGRKLDFLTQEVNRETNTIGSKANDIFTTRIVVDIKSEIEKIREQIQNLE